MRIAVVTANFGHFDSIKEIPRQTIDFDRFYFTESNSPFPFHTIDNRLRAKYFKICPHKVPGLQDYDVFVWVDGNIQIKSTHFLETITNALQGEPYSHFAISPHPTRTSIYQEADFIISEIKNGNGYLKNRYSINAIQKEMNSIGPDTDGLYWCGLFARWNDGYLNHVCAQWWEKNILYTNFDQLNFVQMVHQYELKLSKFNLGNFYKNDYYELIPHNK